MTTNTDADDYDDQQRQHQRQQKKETLDFRDVRRHPPPSSSTFTPLPSDPSWDAHRVYFNERPRSPKTHGDAIDAVFQRETPELELETLMPNDPNDAKQQPPPQYADDDDALDPLGWPVAPEAFRTQHTTNTSTTTTASALTLSPSGDDADDVADDDADDDDLNLLQRRPSFENENAADAVVMEDFVHVDEDDEEEKRRTTAAPWISGVEVTSTGTLLGYHHHRVMPRVDKATRIARYETTGVDEESSVEDDDESSAEGEDDEDDDKLNYQAKEDDDDVDDDDGGAIHRFASFDTECHPVRREMAQLHIEPMTTTTKKPPTLPASFTVPPPPSRPKKSKTTIPLLRPPPPEKVAAWEASARGKKW